MIQQIEFKLTSQFCSFHLINDEVIRHLPQLPNKGLINIFVQLKVVRRRVIRFTCTHSLPV